MKWAWRSAGHCTTLGLLTVAMWTAVLASPASAASSDEETQRNAGFVFTPREVLFFSAQTGQWTAVRLDSGERVLQRAANGNVAAVVTSQRAIGFSAPLNAVQEISVPEEETLEAFRVEGNVVTFVTRRRVYGFSAYTGKWAVLDRFQLGR